jgi:hypothetical protein
MSNPAISFRTPQDYKNYPHHQPPETITIGTA